MSSTFTELAEVLKAYGEGLDAHQLEGQLLLLPQVAASMEFDTPRINIDDLISFFQSIDDSHVASVRWDLQTGKVNKLTSVFYASVLLLIMNFVITLPK